MRNITILLVLFFSFLAFADDSTVDPQQLPLVQTVDWGPVPLNPDGFDASGAPAQGNSGTVSAPGAALSPISYIDPAMRSCYRWISQDEYNDWKSGTIPLINIGAMDGTGWLGRGGHKPYGTFC